MFYLYIIHKYIKFNIIKKNSTNKDFPFHRTVLLGIFYITTILIYAVKQTVTSY